MYRSIIGNHATANNSGDFQQTGGNHVHANAAPPLCSHHSDPQTGVFVISPGADAEVLYTFRENDNASTEFADNEAILKALALWK
jgi:hypothetical protein